MYKNKEIWNYPMKSKLAVIVMIAVVIAVGTIYKFQYQCRQKMDPLAQNSRWQEQELTYDSMSFCKMLVM
jgi:hypothetical protein